jgi:hypothetical protein
VLSGDLHFVMNDAWKTVTGVVVEGHQVASQRSEHYPRGTIELQIPYFKALGLDLTSFHAGTLNVSIAPATMRPISPEFTFRNVRWTTAHPAEDFSFSRCRVVSRGQKHTGWIYYPHPETKERHFQNPSIVEVIAPWMGEIKYGARVEMEVNSEEIWIGEE